jgi:phosphate starvation-inducible PhoH-like protein
VSRRRDYRWIDPWDGRLTWVFIRRRFPLALGRHGGIRRVGWADGLDNAAAGGDNPPPVRPVPGEVPTRGKRFPHVNLSITLEQPGKRLALFGSADRHLRMVRDAFAVQIVNRDEELRVSGQPDQVNRAALVLDHLQKRLRRQDWLSLEDVTKAIAAVAETDRERAADDVEVFAHAGAVKAKTEGQRAYLDAIFKNDLTVCTGPAGTGKTYLAVAAAAALLKRGAAKRLILTRPAVEAGERLGFLPGDLQAKVNPYLRPLFDALGDMMDAEQVKRFMVNDVIEVVPLAFMRGRTLSESVIILDEAQNTTVSQMLMFLTRLGQGSKMIVTGDASQVDLPDGTPSGLADAVQKLRGIEHVGLVALDKSDVVRHRLVQSIVEAYERSSRPVRWGDRPPEPTIPL